jgi:hypothetical protein
VALLALIVAAPTPAAADESLTPSGSITYTWHGDPSRGCAAVNLCGVEGALVVSPHGSATASTFRGSTNFGLDFSASTVRVTGGPGAAAGPCVDVPAGLVASSLFISPGPGGSLVGRIQPPLSSGRCAGPTQLDLGQIALPVSKTGTKRPAFDLRSTQTFNAGPFSGTVDSTLVLRPSSGGFGVSSSSGSASGSFFGPPPRHKVLLERVTLRYRLTSLPGELDAAFSGEPDPFCAALGSCGAGGSLALTLAGLDRTLTISGSRVVRRRVGRRQALADVRRGRLSFFEVNAFGPLSTQVSETFQGQDGSRCAETANDHGVQLFFGSPRRRRGLLATLSEGNALGLVRTHCPGPADSDVFAGNPSNLFGPNSTVASGLIDPAALTSRQTVVSLTWPGSFAGFGYVGTRSGGIPLSLSLERVVHAGTIQVTR